MTAPTSPTSDHPWYRLHPVTWVVFLVTGTGLFYAQFVHVEWIFHGMRLHYFRGWPRFYTGESGSPSGPFPGIYWFDLAVDIMWWLAMVLPPLILSERLARRHFRFSLKTLLGTVSVAAVLLSQLNWRNIASFVAEPGGGGLVFVVSMVFATFCWLLVAAWAICSTCGFLYRGAWRIRNRANNGQT